MNGEWDPDWTAFLKAWHERFSLPPKGEPDEPKSQRATLYRIVSNFPTKAAEWCRSAPAGANSHAVTGHILGEWRRWVENAA